MENDGNRLAFRTDLASYLIAGSFSTVFQPWFLSLGLFIAGIGLHNRSGMNARLEFHTIPPQRAVGKMEAVFARLIFFRNE